jgi:hypothetical protein
MNKCAWPAEAGPSPQAKRFGLANPVQQVKIIANLAVGINCLP